MNITHNTYVKMEGTMIPIQVICKINIFCGNKEVKNWVMKIVCQGRTEFSLILKIMRDLGI